MKTQQGFTLIEIMIVVAIVGILSAVAMPIYSAYMVKGKVVDAHSALTTARIQMEQYYQDNRTYVGAPCPGQSTYFSYNCVSAANTFTITASNLANQGLGSASSYVYTINQNNVRTTTKFAGGTGAACWITKKGQAC